MAHVTISGHTAVPVEHWWAVATDLRRLPEWHTAVVEVKEAVGGAEAGASATLVLRYPDGTHEYRVDVVEVEPLRLLRQSGREVRPGDGHYVSISRSAPAADGGTDWEWEQEAEPPKGALGAMSDRILVRPAMEQMMRQSMERLVALAEREAKTPVRA